MSIRLGSQLKQAGPSRLPLSQATPEKCSFSLGLALLNRKGCESRPSEMLADPSALFGALDGDMPLDRAMGILKVSAG